MLFKISYMTLIASQTKYSELDDTWMKSWFLYNDIEMYSTRNKEKAFVAERFIRTLKNKI